MGIKRNVTKSVGADEILLEDAFEEYVDERSNKWVQDTLNRYRVSFKKFNNYIEQKIKDDEIKIVYEKITANEVNGKMLETWTKHRQNETDAVKNQTINHDLRNMRAFLRWCMKKGFIKNEFTVEMMTEKETDEREKVYSQNEIDALIVKPKRKRNADFIEWRTFTIVCFVLESGSRAASVCNIKMKNVDFVEREIKLTHTKNRLTHNPPMSTAFISTLKEYIRDWRKNANDDDYLFPNVGNEKLTTGALRQSYVTYCKNRGVDKTSIHGLRHTFAKGYLMNNGDTFRLQKMLSHKTLAMTQKYVRIFNNDLKNNFDNLSPFATSKKSSNSAKQIQLSQ